MLKAFVVKAVAIAACAVALWLCPPGWSLWAVVAIVAATVAFFAYAIAAPKSQFFAPVLNRLTDGERAVALTFDDGPDPVVTPRVLDVLHAYGAHATFFVVGERAARHPELIRRMRAEGHAVGTHTQHHRLRFHFGSRAYVRREIVEAVDEVGSILSESPALFRPPQGLRTPYFSSGWRTVSGQVCVTWSVRGLDSLRTTAAAIVRRIEARLVPGAIIALHDGVGLGGSMDREPTLAALPRIFAACRVRDLRCVALEPHRLGLINFVARPGARSDGGTGMAVASRASSPAAGER